MTTSTSTTTSSTMTSGHITVVYKWTAKPGRLEELTKIYGEVTEAMRANEPDAEAVHCYVSEEDNALYVRDEFKNAGALGLHLSTTAPAHFPKLLEIATPGAFSFLGDVPAELKQGVKQMGLPAEFSTHAFGFNR